MATKKLQILDSMGFVKTTEQTLTPEQKEQVRSNIGVHAYDWHEFGSYVGGTGLYVANYLDSNNFHLTEWDTLLSLTSAVNDTIPLMHYLHSRIHNALFSQIRFRSYTDEQILTTCNNIIAELDKAIEHGALPYYINGYRWTYIYASGNPHSTFNQLVYSIVYLPNNNQLTITDVIENQRIIIRNGAIYQNTILPKYDTTLTYAHTAADAKAVGDALANKIGIDEIATDDEIIEMLAQEDMLPVVADADGGILADENENILLW